VSAHPHAGKSCRDLVAQINDYLEGELSPARVHALERHLEECTCCTGFAATLRQAVVACRESGSRTLPAAVRRRARARIAEIMRGAGPGAGRR
jgi:anti-sigma factor RsiW